MKIKVVTDYNDGDYITHIYNIDESVVNKFLPLMEAINNFEPYPYSLGIEYSNFMLGEICDSRQGNKTPYVAYSNFSKEYIDEFIDTFLNFNLSEYGIHTIVEISDVVTDKIYIKSEYPEKYQRTNDNVKAFLETEQKLLKEWADLCGCSVKEVGSFKFSDMSEAALEKYNEYNNLWKQFRTDLVMTRAELRASRNKIRSEAQSKCRELEVQFALEHNTVKIGDVIGHTSFPKKIIRVKRITVPDFGEFGTPECLYYGNVIDSNSGKEYDDLNDELFQSYVDEINGIPYKHEVK